LTFNYARAFSDYLVNFMFGKGVEFRSPKETEAIVPRILERVWEEDNDKERVLWEIGNQGSVSGDVFVKVAYEEPYVWPQPDPETGVTPQGILQRFYPGKVRILPLNSSFCFPEFHPHDRQRLLRFKLKYKFWGTSAEGTRQVFTYTEIITDTVIEEYINDQLIEGSPRPNPLGRVPIANCPNMMVSGSPWGLSDIHDILTLNREYNEKATDVSDIINYHAAPVTVVTGAKANQLEKGPKKVWSGLPRDAQVYNLELGANLQGPLEYMALLKTAMHEMTGVHESALGQVQPISNTSGVALAIQFQPVMMRYHQKRIQYDTLLRQINEFVLMTIAIKEPGELQWIADETAAPLRPGQLPVLDPNDPITYRSTVHWPPPLPLDVLIKLNEEMIKQQMGIQSKRGTLRELGFQFPDEKMAEVFDELVEDIEDQGALDIRRAILQRIILEMTGMMPDGQPVENTAAGQPQDVKSAGGSGVSGAGGTTVQQNPPAIQPSLSDMIGGGAGMGNIPGMEQGDVQLMVNSLLTRAMGTKLPQRRTPEDRDDAEDS